jgi:hypothetical protein
MNSERPNELEAKRIVERVTGMALKHADANGGVDYLSTDGQHALEVDALAASREAGMPDGELPTCWLVFTSDTQRRLKAFRQRVHVALVDLERAGETFFDRGRAGTHLIERGPLSHIYQPLLDAGVERASAMPNHAHKRNAHQVIPSLGTGGSSSGSDQALDLLIKMLSRNEDNPKKLEASGVGHRHLFVWLDDDTRFDIARPLSHEPPPWGEERFGTPSTPPALDPAITHLWVVHESSRMGWLWYGKTWQELHDL